MGRESEARQMPRMSWEADSLSEEPQDTLGIWRIPVDTNSRIHHHKTPWASEGLQFIPKAGLSLMRHPEIVTQRCCSQCTDFHCVHTQCTVLPLPVMCGIGSDKWLICCALNNMNFAILEKIIIPVPITKPHFVSFPVHFRRVGKLGLPGST